MVMIIILNQDNLFNKFVNGISKHRKMIRDGIAELELDSNSADIINVSIASLQICLCHFYYPESFF